MQGQLPRSVARLLQGAFAALAIGLACMAGAQGEESISEPVTLRSQISVTGNQITLGDVFNGVDKYAERAIARAPGPGKQITLKASWLWRVANFYNLDWRPTSRLDTSTVTRASIEIDSEQMLHEINSQIREKLGEDTDREVVLDRNLISIQLPTDVEPSIKVRNLHMDRQNGRFTATVVAPASGNVLASVALSGTIHEMVEVTVPARRLLREDIIRKSDLKTVRLRRKNIRRDAVTAPEHMIGMAAKRTLIAGRQISLDDIQMPVLVKRNTKVTVSFKTQFMQLTAQAKAMESGAKGDIIQVRNMNSGKLIEVEVTGPNEVTIAQPVQSAMR